ncbi:MAG: Sec-independent protein translocase subunit TatA [Nocardia sp.]|nr:Sec-independent protein translocase subunit TatA [Nocardia sp.]
MGSLSPTHWVIIALVILVLFGAKRLPDAARGLGRSLRIFKTEMNEMHSEGSGSQGQSAAPTQSAPGELPSGQSANPAAQADKDHHKA